MFPGSTVDYSSVAIEPLPTGREHCFRHFGADGASFTKALLPPNSRGRQFNQHSQLMDFQAYVKKYGRRATPESYDSYKTNYFKKVHGISLIAEGPSARPSPTTQPSEVSRCACCYQ